MGTRWTYDDPRWRRIDLAFVTLYAGMAVYSVLVWRNVIGDGTAWRPFQMVTLSIGLLLQALTPFARRLSPLLFYVTIAAALIALGYSVLAR